MREGIRKTQLTLIQNKIKKIIKTKGKEKMTTREFLNTIIEGNFNDELTAFAQAEIEKLDHTNEVRRAKMAEKSVAKQAEKAPLRDAIYAVITDEPKTATMLIEEAGLELKPQSIPSLLKTLVENGSVTKVDVKIKGKGTQRGYVRA